MPSHKNAWRRVLGSVLGSKTSMKESKAAKRAVKQARLDPDLSALTKAEAAASLRAFLG
jgi:hypothetical protein